jgi:protein-S-isoprenylcysteine O-methyltransferase Ste14
VAVFPAAVIWLAFHLFVVLHEEPDLRERFGNQYEVYLREVPRWIPRPRKPRQP